jgi:glycine hydroxymethyltransferase
MIEIADIISFVIDNKDGDLTDAKKRVKALCDRFPLYQ